MAEISDFDREVNSNSDQYTIHINPLLSIILPKQIGRIRIQVIDDPNYE